MSDNKYLQTPFILSKIGKVFCIIAFFIPVINLLLRIIDYNLLIKVTPGVITQNPLSSICLALIGISLWLIRNENPSKRALITARSIAIFVSLIGIGKTISIILKVDYTIDTILFRDQLFVKGFGWNGMAPNSAVGLCLLSIAIFLMDIPKLEKTMPSQYINYFIFLASLVSLYGYIYGLEELYIISTLIPQSFYTALCLFLFTSCCLFIRPHKGSMRTLLGESPTEVILLRFLALILPLIFGWLRIKGEKLGLYDKEIGTSLFAVFTFIMSMFLLGLKSSSNKKLREAKKQINDMIKEEAQRLNFIFDNSSTAIYIRDLDGEFSMVNKKFEEIFGVERKDIIDKSPEKIFSNNIQDWFKQDKTILDHAKLSNREEEVNTSKGLFHLITLKFPLCNKDQIPYALCGISTDISDLKKSEKIILGNEKMIKDIIEMSGEGIVVGDTKGSFFIFNNKATQMLGDNPANFEEASELFEVFYKDKVTPLPKTERPMIKALKKESTDDLELFTKSPKHPEGRILKVNGMPLERGDGEAFGAVVYKDITKRRLLQEALTKNYTRLKNYLTTSGEGVMIAYKNGKIIFYNPTIKTIVGENPVELDIIKWAESYDIYSKDNTTLLKYEEFPLVRALNGEKIEEMELYIQNVEENKRRKILASASPIRDKEGNIVAAIVNFRDITTFKHLEDLLKDLEENYLYLIGLTKKKKE